MAELSDPPVSKPDTKPSALDVRRQFHQDLMADGLYTKDFDTFTKTFADPAIRKQFHKDLVDDKVYTKSYEDFSYTFFEDIDLKKKDTSSAVSATPAEQPATPLSPNGAPDFSKDWINELRPGQQAQVGTLLPEVVVENDQSGLLDRVNSGVGSVLSGASNYLLSAPLKSLGELGNYLDNKTSGGTSYKLEENPLYRLGNYIEKELVPKMTYVNKKYEGEFATATVPTVAGQALGAIITAPKSLAQAGITLAKESPEIAQAALSAFKTLSGRAALFGAATAADAQYQDALTEMEAVNTLSQDRYVAYKKKQNPKTTDQQIKDQYVRLKKSKPEDIAFEAWLKSIPGGMTDALPVAKLFGRMDKILGGTLKNVILQKAVQTGKAGIEGAIEESIQKAYENFTAQQVYDNTRAILSDVVEEGAAGGTVQALLTALLGGVRGRKASASGKDLELFQKAEDEAAAKLQEIDDNIAELEAVAATDEEADATTETITPDTAAIDGGAEPAVVEDGAVESVGEGLGAETGEIAPIETIRVFRGAGNNIAKGSNEGFSWVAQDESVAKQYASVNDDGSFNVEASDIPLPKNIFDFNFNSNVEVKGSDISDILMNEVGRQFEAGVISEEQMNQLVADIETYEQQAGENLEKYHTKINKKSASKTIAGVLSSLGYDAIRIDEQNSEGELTPTYGLIKQSDTQVEPTVEDVNDIDVANIDEDAVTELPEETKAELAKNDIDVATISNAEARRQQIEEDKEYLRTYWKGLKNIGIINDPKRNAKEDVEVAKRLIRLAVNSIIDGSIKTVNDFAKFLGADEVNEQIENAFEQANKLMAEGVVNAATIKGKKTIKGVIRENTDRRSKEKVVMTELQAIKRQMQDFGKGFKAGQIEGTTRQKATQADLDAQAKTIRDGLTDTITAIRDGKLFNGKSIPQTSLLTMLKNLNEAGGNVRKLERVVNDLTRRLEVIGYDNKISNANKFRGQLSQKFFKGNQKEVSAFLSVDPETIPSNEMDWYMDALDRLKNDDPVDFDSLMEFRDDMQQYAVQTHPTPALSINVAAPEFVKPQRQMAKEWEDALKQFNETWLSYRGGLPKDVFALREKWQGFVAGEINKAKLIATELDRLLSKSPFVDIGTVDKALRRDENALLSLPGEIADRVIQQRAHIDALSTMLINEGLVEDTSKIAIELHLGQYLNRSFKVHSDKNWTIENLPEELYNKAAQELYKEYYPQYENEMDGAREAEVRLAVQERAKAEIEKIFAEGQAEMKGNGKKMGSRDLSTLRERKDISPALLALMGEVTDPLNNYLQSVFKTASLVGNSMFLKQVRDVGMGSILFKANDPKRPTTHHVLIAAEGSESLAPLNGLYATPEFVEAFKEEQEQRKEWARLYLKVVGAIKMGKTIFSPITHFKNVEGNFGIVLMNGHLNPSHFTKAAAAVWSDFKKKSNAQTDKIIDTLIRLGVLNQNVSAGDIREMFELNKSSDAIFMRNIGRKRGVLETIKFKANRFKQGTIDVYEMEDNFFKVLGYLQDRERYGHALHGDTYDNLTTDQQAEVDNYVGDLLKKTYPTFSRVPKIARAGSQFGVPLFGNFVSFAAESYRVGINLVKQAGKEMRSDNPEIRKIGTYRMAGIAGYTFAKGALLHWVGMAGLGGIVGLLADDKEEEEVRANAKRYVADFSKASDLVVLQASNGKLRYVDFSSYDPFGNQSKIMNVLTDERDSPEKALGKAALQVIAPFSDQDLTLRILLQIENNEDSYHREIYEIADDESVKAQKIFAYAFKQAEPGVFSLVRRFATKDDTQAEAQAFLYRVYETDIAKTFGYKLKDHTEYIKSAEDTYKNTFYDKSSTDEDKREALEKANKKVLDRLKEVNKDYQAALSMGANRSDLMQAMRNFRVSAQKRSQILNPADNRVFIREKQ